MLEDSIQLYKRALELHVGTAAASGDFSQFELMTRKEPEKKETNKKDKKESTKRKSVVAAMPRYFMRNIRNFSAPTKAS